jgi:hypothetical protein
MIKSEGTMPRTHQFLFAFLLSAILFTPAPAQKLKSNATAAAKTAATGPLN